MSAGIRAGSSNDGYVQVNGNDIITALSGGNVGIGNTSPSTKLHVNGTVTATNFAGNISGTPTFAGDLTIPQWIIHDGDTNTKLGFPTTDEFEIHAGGGPRLRIESTGEVWVKGGTLKLGSTNGSDSIIHTTNAAGILYRADENGHRFQTFSGSWKDRLTITDAGKVNVKSNAANSVAIALVDNDSSNEIWRVGQAADGDGYVEVLEDGGTVGCKLDASGNSFTMGNFGIGVASPDGPLHIFSGSAGSVSPDAGGNELVLESSGNTGMSILSPGTGESTIFFGNPGTNGQKDGYIRYWHESHSTTANRRCLTFVTGGGDNERLRITSTGDLSLRSTTQNAHLGLTANSTAINLTLGSTAGANPRMYFYGTGNGQSSAGDIFMGAGSGGILHYRSAGLIKFEVNSDSTTTEALRITSAGNLEQNGGTGISYFKGSGEYIFGSNQSSPPSGGSEAGVQIHSYKTRAHFSINAYMNNAGGPFMQFISSRSGTVGTLGTKCQNNDYLGEIRFLGDNGTNYNSLCQGASIYAQAASTPADGDTTIGGELHFVTGTGSGGSQPVRLTIDSGGRSTFTGEVHISDKLVHKDDHDTNLEFGANTLVLKAGNRTAINCNSNMTEISSPVQYNNSRNYSTNSTTTWQTIFTFSVAGCPGFSMECAARENNYTTIHRVSGSAQWNSVYYTADFAGDSSHSHSSDIMFRILNDSGTKRLQFKASQYTTTRTVSIISVWVASGYVTWS